MRESCLDLGKKYTYRVFIYSGVFLAFYLVFLGFLLMRLFRVLKQDLPIAVYVTGSYDVLFVLGCLFQMLRTGAQVNGYFDKHKGELIKIKKVLHNAKNHLDSTIERYKSGHQSNQLYSRMLQELRTKHRDEDFLSDSIDLIDMAIQDLEYSKETNPLKIMGLTASGELLTSIYTGLASIGFALLQFYISDI